MDSTTLPWHVSSYSTGNGACIEVAKTSSGAYFRDTKDRPRGAAAVAPTRLDHVPRRGEGGHARRLTLAR
ncbi:DUF397 domain-containing protein [Streptomyces bacillaris]|uniref:DUF397 domain-containing protein n=1 Tax=Streptomyces bacillaris TaxID=68179 RepID=UPI0035E14A3C